MTGKKMTGEQMPFLKMTVSLTAAAALVTPVISTSVMAPAAASEIYEVTSRKCTGSGSWTEAVSKANAHPGPDTITFRKGLTVDLSSCVRPSSVKPQDWYSATLTESTTIEGNGATVDGSLGWVNNAGLVNSKNACPSSASGYTIVTYAPALAEIGRFRQDNAGVDVTIKNLEMKNLPSALKVWDNAAVSVSNSGLSEINSIYSSCATPAIDANSPGAAVTFSNSRLSDSWAFNGARGTSAGIFADNGNVIVENSVLNHVDMGYAIWSSGTTKVVTSQLVNSGGVHADGTGVFDLVNSVVNIEKTDPGLGDQSSVTDGRLNVTASTLAAFTTYCTNAFTGNVCNPPGLPVTVNGVGTYNLVQSAVGAFVTAEGQTLGKAGGGVMTSDRLTWVQSTATQPASAVNALLPNALTAAPGLPTTGSYYYPAMVTPLLGTPSAPGQLIDAVPDADPGEANSLINPIDGKPITTDVFNNPRVDGNGRRNIGAVQTSLAPVLAVTLETKQSITVSWSRPGDPSSGPITGYGLFYRPKGTTGWTRIDVAGASTLTNKVTGLSPNTTYEFKVVAVNNTGDGPPSKVVSGTTLPDPHLSYPDITGQVGKAIDPAQPQTNDLKRPVTYVVSKGALPDGLTLDPDSGKITGTPKNAGTTTVTIAVVDANGVGASTDVRITISEKPPQPSLQYPNGKGEQNKRLDPLVPHTSGLTGRLTYTVIGGSLPSGTRLSPSTGAILGRPTESGKFVVRVRVDGNDGSATATARLSIRKTAVPVTPLAVKARPSHRDLRVGRPTEVVKWAKSTGRVRVLARCLVNGHPSGRHCETKVNQRRHSVTVTAKCNTDVIVAVRVTAKAKGMPRAIWGRSWTVDSDPRHVCTGRGKG